MSEAWRGYQGEVPLPEVSVEVMRKELRGRVTEGLNRLDLVVRMMVPDMQEAAARMQVRNFHTLASQAARQEDLPLYYFATRMTGDYLNGLSQLPEQLRGIAEDELAAHQIPLEIAPEEVDVWSESELRFYYNLIKGEGINELETGRGRPAAQLPADIDQAGVYAAKKAVWEWETVPAGNPGYEEVIEAQEAGVVPEASRGLEEPELTPFEALVPEDKEWYVDQEKVIAVATARGEELDEERVGLNSVRLSQVAKRFRGVNVGDMVKLLQRNNIPYYLGKGWGQRPVVIDREGYARLMQILREPGPEAEAGLQELPG